MVTHKTDWTLNNKNMTHPPTCRCTDEQAMFPDCCTDQWKGVDCKKCLKMKR
jgi:hypothetical protein